MGDGAGGHAGGLGAAVGDRVADLGLERRAGGQQGLSERLDPGVLLLARARVGVRAVDEDVRQGLVAMDVETFYGKVKFGKTGQITSLEPPVFQIQGGKPVVIHPAAIKQADFKFMPK